MVIVFVTKDKTGRAIHLSRERWSHIQKHPEMVGKLDDIQETLQRPDMMVPSMEDPAVCFYFRYDKSRVEHLFISVKYLNGSGFVITSFYTDKAQ